MDWLSRIVAWLSDHEAAISGVVKWQTGAVPPPRSERGSELGAGQKVGLQTREKP